LIESSAFPEYEFLRLSTWDSKTVLLRHGASRDQITILPLGVPRDIFYRNTEQSSVSNELLFVTSPGRERLKGFHLLLKAIHHLKDQFPYLTVHVAGCDRLPQSLREEFETIDSFLEFHGWKQRENLASLYRRVDAYIQPSYIESDGGTTLFEALSSGTPSIATDANPFREAAHGENILFFDRGDSSSLMDAIIRFYETPTRYRSAAWNHAPEYDIMNTYESLTRLYSRLATKS
jgi:glycosyltransferase involved in cell wall biosynthesis